TANTPSAPAAPNHFICSIVSCPMNPRSRNRLPTAPDSSPDLQPRSTARYFPPGDLLAQLVQPLHPGFQLRRQRRFDRDLLSARRLAKPNAPRVQEIPPERRSAFDFGWRAIDAIPDYRMPQAREMYPDLVRPPGPDAHFQQRELAETLQHAVFGAGRAAFAQPRGHARAPHRIARNGPLYASALRFYDSVYQGEVDLLHLPAGELRG